MGERKRHKRERDIAEENDELIRVEIDDAPKEGSCCDAGDKDAPAGKYPQSDDAMQDGESPDEHCLRDTKFPHEGREVADPIGGVLMDCVRGVEEGESQGYSQ